MSIARRLIGLSVVLVLPCYWIASEVMYARSKQPSGIETLADYFLRLGEPTRIVQFDHDGVAYYQLYGLLPEAKWVWAFPSSPPAYIFDSAGHFVDWSSDPGDDPAFHERWPLISGRTVEPQQLRKRLQK